MKGLYLLPGVLFLILVTGCPEKSEQSQSKVSTEQVNPEGMEEQMTPAQPETPATVILDRLWVNPIDPDGKGQYLEIGEEVTIIGELQPDPKNEKNQVYPIRLDDGNEAFGSFYYVIPDTKPAVVIIEAKIYSEAKLTKLTKQDELMPLTIVGADIEGPENDFIKVNFSDENRYAKHDRYIKSEYVSYNKNDISAALLYNLAMNSDDKSMKSEFLSSAAQQNSPAFGILIDDEIFKMGSEEIESESIDESEEDGSMDDESMDESEDSVAMGNGNN